MPSKNEFVLLVKDVLSRNSFALNKVILTVLGLDFACKLI